MRLLKNKTVRLLKRIMTKTWITRALNLLEHSLIPVPQELNELDWKENISPDPKKTSRHLSAFANLPGGGFIVFGINDKTGKPFGITRENTELIVQKIGNYSRENLEPAIITDHTIEEWNGTPVLIVYVKESPVKPVFPKPGHLEDACIRSGGTTRKASRQEIGSLLLNSKIQTFEELYAGNLLSRQEVIHELEYRTILLLLKKPLGQNNEEILAWLESEKMIVKVNGAGYYISNFGALVAAYNLSDFESLARKAVRVIKYRGKNKLVTEKEYPITKGYATGFENLIELVKALLPALEIIKNGLRVETTVFPEIALRELIANSLIHQDFTIRGTSPMIEIFDDRIEISNPGKLLPSQKIDRLIRATPESRNELLASAFRRYNICEERGSGLEKAVSAIENYSLPPLRFEEFENSFRVTIYGPKTFAQLSKPERIEACYQHCILKYYAGEAMNSKSLRDRFNLKEKERAKVSEIIKEAIKIGKIKPKNEGIKTGRLLEYIPAWG